MPLYEYECKRCSKTFEKLVRAMSAAKDEPKAECPSCGSKQTARKFSVVAVGTAGEAPTSAAPGCGRCGGPGPCGMDD